MTFPTGWQRRATVTIDPVEVDGTLTDFPLLCTVANLPSEMFDADGSNPVQNGGGDIRFSSDEDGDTRLACEVVSFVTDNNPANGTAEIWVKVASVSSTVDTIIYVWYKTNQTESQPAVTDTYGRNAVWSNGYAGVWHMEEDPSGSAPQMVDSTGNGNDGTTNGSMTSGDSVTGQIGQGLEFDGLNDYVSVASSASLDSTTGSGQQTTLAVWVKFTNHGNRVICEKGTNKHFIIQSNNTKIYGGLGGGRDTVATLDSGTWRHYAITYNAGGVTKQYVDGEFDVSKSETRPADSSDPLVFGARNGGSSAYTGELDNLFICNRDLSSDEIAANYSNQNAPGTFATAGTPVDVSGPDGSGTPPPSYLLEGESRALDFHHHQMFDVITGSGEVASSGTHLNVLQCLGSGPLYNVWLSSTYPPANSGVDRVQVGDFLIIGEDDDHVWNTSNISWYKYHIEEILTNASVQSGEFRVRYIKDTENLGDDDPCNLYTTYSDGGGYSDEANEKVSMVVRRVNVDFLLGN